MCGRVHPKGAALPTKDPPVNLGSQNVDLVHSATTFIAGYDLSIGHRCHLDNNNRVVTFLKRFLSQRMAPWPRIRRWQFVLDNVIICEYSPEIAVQHSLNLAQLAHWYTINWTSIVTERLYRSRLSHMHNLCSKSSPYCNNVTILLIEMANRFNYFKNVI